MEIAIDSIRSTLSQIPFFEPLTQSGGHRLDELIRASEVLSCQRGEDIIVEGEQGDGMYVLLEGAAQVHTMSDEGEVVLCGLQAGDYFGEQAVMPGGTGRRNAGVRATLDGKLLYTCADVFKSFVLRDPKLVAYLQAVGEEQLQDRMAQKSALLRSLSLTEEAADWLEQEDFADGEIVFHEGDVGDKFYLIVSGNATVTRKEGEKIKVLANLGPGRFFGELALINAEPRTATVTAEGVLSTLTLKGDTFLRLYRENPELQAQMEHLRGAYQLPGQTLLTLHEGDLLGKKGLTAIYHMESGAGLSATKVIGEPIFNLRRLDVDESGAKRVSYTDASAGVARELRVVGNRVASATTVGTWADLGRLQQLTLRGEPVRPWQLALFRLEGELWLEDEAEDFADSAIVCKCAGVTRGTLNEAVAAGANSVEALGKKTGACQVCGSCAPLLAEIVGQTDMMPARLLEVIPVTDEIRSFRFRPVSGEVAPSLPGQHFRIETQINGRWVQRAYTLTSPAGQQDYFEISVKREAKGLFSRWLHDRMQEDSFVRVSQPRGEYFLPPEHQGPVVFFAGGIGVTPALAMMRTLVRDHDPRSLYVDYSARTRSQFAYADEWRKAMDDNDTIDIHFRAGDEEGRVQPEDVERLAERYPGAMFFLCGPKPFQDAIAGYIRGAGIPEERIRVEHFVPPGGNKPAVVPVKFAPALAASAALIFVTALVMGLSRGWSLQDALGSWSAFWGSVSGRQVSGFAVLGLIALAPVMSLVKRFRDLPLGPYSHWRFGHVIVGLGVLSLLTVHVGFEWNIGPHYLLLYGLLGLLAAGSLATMGVLIENREVSALTQNLRRWSYRLHVAIAWPLLAMLGVHIYTVYYF